MNVVDLRSCLESWPYDAERNVRMGRGADGREIIWVRQPMGLEQYEIDGRPDGRRVHGEETRCFTFITPAFMRRSRPSPQSPSN